MVILLLATLTLAFGNDAATARDANCEYDLADVLPHLVLPTTRR